MCGQSVKNKTSNDHNSATRQPIDFMLGSRLGFFSKDRLALFSLTAHELHELYYDRPPSERDRMDFLEFRCITGRFYAVFTLSRLSFYGQLLEQLSVASKSRPSVVSVLLIVTVILWANK